MVPRLPPAIKTCAVVAFLKLARCRQSCYTGRLFESFFNAGISLAGLFTHSSNFFHFAAGIVTRFF